MYTVGRRVVHKTKTDDWSLIGSCFVIGRKSLLMITWNGFYLLKSSSDYVFRVVSFRMLAVLFQVFVLVVHL